MPSIVTLTMNPAVDVSTATDRVVPEDKLRCAAPRRDPGGGGLNVARAISRLGGEARALYTCGGPSGEALQRLLDAERVDHVPVPVDGWTRESWVVLESSTNAQYRFNLPGAQLTDAEVARCREAALDLDQGDHLVVSGSLPPGASPDLLTELAAGAREAGARLVVDTSGEALRRAVEVGVDLLKPNAGELAALLGADHLGEEDIADAARELVGGGRVRRVVVSLGAAGVIAADADGQVVRAIPPIVEVRSRVGAGDSSVAGLVLASSRGEPFAEVVRLGVAAGTAAVMTDVTELCRRDDFEALLPRVRVL
jgi:6-phosphofructokinase 2